MFYMLFIYQIEHVCNAHKVVLNGLRCKSTGDENI